MQFFLKKENVICKKTKKLVENRSNVGFLVKYAVKLFYF